MSPDAPSLSRATSNQDNGMDETLDLRGLKCPLPALMTRKALAKGWRPARC